jgi:serine-type D-Ala-D-Ala carboxypeptidase/endopeptidase (penicillin-binding protein 4)
MKNSRLILIILILAACGFSFSQETRKDTIPKDTTLKYSYSTIAEFGDQMEDIFNDPNFHNAQWGVVIQSLETGEYFYKSNEDKLLIPASGLKLLTTAAALKLLGPEYRFSTNVFINGRIDGSILIGDLIVQGRGDPTISGRFYSNNIFKVYSDWADSLLEMGIDEVNGNLIGDDNEFDDSGLGAGWEWDYESYWFAAPSGAIAFNDNTVDIIVTVNKQTSQSLITLHPNTNYLVAINNVSVVSGDTLTSIDINRQRGSNIVNVYGVIRENDSLKTFVSVNNPTQYSMVILKDVLEEKGIKITGFPMDVDDISKPINYGEASRIITYYSPPLKEIIKIINKNSHNFFAEQLLKVIGLEKLGYGTAEFGVDASEEAFREMGINPESLIMMDGSGLSRLNLVTAKQFVSLLTFMYKSKNFVPFYNSLPIAGVDGTLGTRMKNSRAQNKVRAKTGYLGAVRNLSGYAYTGDDEPVAFSIIVNNFNVPVKLAENIQDLVCLRLANFRRK